MAVAQTFLKQPAIVRAAPLIVVTLIMVVGLIAIWSLREPSMTTLFPRLGDEDKAQVMQTLAAQGVQAKLDQSTGQVLVPRGDFYKAKMLLAQAGLPKASVSGYEMITQMPLGASRAVEQIKLKQAQENELARSIMEIRDVEGARVHLAVPERSAFVRDQTPPTASVFLKLSAGRSLSNGQVQSIAHLVSSSVPHLPVANVTIVDQFGGLLTAPQRDADLGLTAQQLEHKMRLEKLLRERVVNLLTPVIGPGNFNTEVNADLDFTRTEQTREFYDPNNNAIRSQQESLQESADAKARGIPGATSNQPPNAAALSATPQPSAQGEQKNRSSTSVRNFEISREVKSTRPALGEIKRLSVAVILRAASGVDEAGNKIEKQLGAPERERLTSLLQEAIGFDAQRGDKITLVSSNFADEQKFSERGWYDAPWLEDAIKQLVILLILAVVVLGALKPFLTTIRSH
jgi:flagellar M-ring protein FliF